MMMSAGALRPAAGQTTDQVVITGGADASQHNYEWEVTNRSNARIVRIEFPQYAADLFITPDTWKQGSQKEMNLVNVGWNSKVSGVCWAEPIAPYSGLAPGASAKFGMRIARMGANRETGSVRVKFEDGSEATVANVELPTMPERGSAWLALVGTGVIFVLFIVYNERRRRRQPAVEEEA